MFDTVYRKPVRFLTSPGESYLVTYQLKVDDDGVRELKPVGKIDTYSRIQSYKESTDINVILQRFVNGDQSALSKVQGVYGDFTNMPTTLAELSQRVLDAENLFNSLPLSVRSEFNFSPSEFFASIGSDRFNEIFRDPSSTGPDDATDPVPVPTPTSTVAPAPDVAAAASSPPASQV